MFSHKENNLIACICEGNAEYEIIEMLLENNLLEFNRANLLDGKLFTRNFRSPRTLETRYLGQDFSNQKIEIVRVGDSLSERYNVKGIYKEKIENIFNCFTTPEIESLLLIHENEYDNFKRSSYTKPSDYCKQVLKMKDIKRTGYWEKYFSNIDDLVKSITEYHRIRPRKNEASIYSLLKEGTLL